MSRFVRTYKIRKAFLDQLEVGNSASYAAMAAGAKLRNFKAWRKDDKDFADDWDEAEDAGTDHIEDVATTRALEKSDTLMLAILKARRPEKYDRGGKLELSGGISVEGAKTSLLNKIARIQAQSRQEVLQERKALEGAAEETEESGEEGSETTAQGTKALPAPAAKPERGAKRRAANSGGRRAAASA